MTVVWRTSLNDRLSEWKGVGLPEWLQVLDLLPEGQSICLVVEYHIRIRAVSGDQREWCWRSAGTWR